MNKKYYFLLIIFLFFTNKGAIADYNKCIKYFQNNEYQSSFNECKRIAIANNDLRAINHLAYMFISGKLPSGLKKNYKKGISLYKISANEGNAKAQFNLGIFYSRGVGVKQNYLEAAFWLSLSKNEIEKANEELEKIITQLSKLQKDELNIKIDEWFNGNSKEKIIPINPDPPTFIPKNLRLAGFGTGFFFDTSSMITNHHVIKGCKALTIIIKDKRYLAKVIKHNKNLDLALLNVNYKNKFYVKFEGNKLEQGEEIIIVGFPLPGMLNTNVKVTDGIVSSLYGLENDPNTITHTAPIQPGNSGGPVFSEKGTVVAVVVSTYTHKEIMEELGGYIPQNINFAIKGEKVIEFIKKSNSNYESINGTKNYKPKEIIKIGNLTTKMVECWK